MVQNVLLDCGRYGLQVELKRWGRIGIKLGFTIRF